VTVVLKSFYIEVLLRSVTLIIKVYNSIKMVIIGTKVNLIIKIYHKRFVLAILKNNSSCLLVTTSQSLLNDDITIWQ